MTVAQPNQSSSNGDEQTAVEIFENSFRDALADMGIVDREAYEIIIRTIEPRQALIREAEQRGEQRGRLEFAKQLKKADDKVWREDDCGHDELIDAELQQLNKETRQ